MAKDNRSVRSVMTADPECVTESDSVRDAARIMKNEDTGVVPVLSGKKIIGMITDRDIVVRGIADGKDIGTATVRDLMTRNVHSVREDADINDALQLMREGEIRRVPVVNEREEIVGIVSIGDISVDTNQAGKVGRTIEDISEAPPNN
jgi:CBS domain-containing protein